MTESIELYFYPSEQFRLGEYKGIPLLYYEGYGKYRNNFFNDIFKDLGFYKYYLRHGDDGNWVVPVSIEDNFVWVNYAGCIITIDDLSPSMEEGWLQLSEDEGYDVIGDDSESIDIFEFINKHSKSEE